MTDRDTDRLKKFVMPSAIIRARAAIESEANLFVLSTMETPSLRWFDPPPAWRPPTRSSSVDSARTAALC